MSDEFVDHFNSQAHIDRVERASSAAVDHLKNIALLEDNGLLMSMSEAMGRLYGIATYYRSLGLNHQGQKVFTDIAKFIGE